MRLSIRPLILRACSFSALAVLALHAAGVSAQCTSYTSGPLPIPWPSQTQFIPANPVAGDPIEMVLGPPTLMMIIGRTVTRNGQDIVVTGTTFIFGGVPPPPGLTEIELGNFPAGNYEVRLRFTQDGSACPEMVIPLVVGPIPEAVPIPAMSDRAWQGGLMAGLFALALARRNRRRVFRH